MGMSASQARLLSVTSRINDVELRSQQIANIKLRLADESERVSTAYTKALNKQKISYTTFTNGTSAQVDLTVAELMKPDSKYRLVAADGKMLVSAAIKKNYSERMESWNKFVNGTFSTDNIGWKNDMMNNTNNMRYHECEAEFLLQEKFGVPSYKWVYTHNDYTAEEASEGTPGLVTRGLISQAEVNYYHDLFAQLFAATSSDPIDVPARTFSDGSHIDAHQDYTVNVDALISVDAAYMNDSSWLYSALESGEFKLEYAATGQEVSVSGDSTLMILSDNSDIAKAEAEYNAATLKINNKEKKLDMQLKALDTEHSALTTEQDSLKSLIGDNVSKSFNIFS